MRILLTGATSGIGFATLKHLVGEGHEVYAIGRNFDKIESFLSENLNQIHKYVFDLNETEQIETLFRRFDLSELKFDSFVHCAGIEETCPLKLYSPDKVKRLYNINVFAGMELLRQFTKKKYSVEKASVVFLSSVMGILGQPGKVGYCSSKSAVIGMVNSAALEFSKRKIRVNAVLPGVVDTPMTQALFEQLSEDGVTSITNMHPLGLGTVEDITPLISFLISDNSCWITGQSIVVDGGYSIQ